MKKFSFFPVLLIALFMFLGFESSAQTYVSVDEAIVRVNNTVSQTPTQAVATATKSESSQSVISNGMTSRVGKALLAEFKNNVDVSKAFENVAANFSVGTQRQQYKVEAISFYKNLLIL